MRTRSSSATPGILGQLEDAAVVVQPRQLAVEQAAVGACSRVVAVAVTGFFILSACHLLRGEQEVTEW